MCDSFPFWVLDIFPTRYRCASRYTFRCRNNDDVFANNKYGNIAFHSRIEESMENNPDRTFGYSRCYRTIVKHRISVYGNENSYRRYSAFSWWDRICTYYVGRSG